MRNFHANLSGQKFDRFRKSQTIILHEKIYRIAMCAAAEAIKKLFDVTDRKRGGFFCVKGAAGKVIIPGFFFQGNATIDQIDDVCSIQKLLNEFTRDLV